MHQNRFRLFNLLLAYSCLTYCLAYSAHPDPLAVFKGPTSKGKEGEREEHLHLHFTCGA